jgi:hypothetical protein
MKTTKALPMSLLTAALMTFAAGVSGQEIVPITATLPIKAVGEACAELNLGTTANPNLVAAEGVAITSDRSSLLTCQSGMWAKQVSSSGFQCYQLTFSAADGGGNVKAIGLVAGTTFTGIVPNGGYSGDSSSVLGNLAAGTRNLRCYASVSCVKTQRGLYYSSNGDWVAHAEVRNLPILSAIEISCIDGTY